MKFILKNQEKKIPDNQLPLLDWFISVITGIIMMWPIAFHLLTRGDIRDPNVYEQYLVSVVLIFITNIFLTKKKPLKMKLLSLSIFYFIMVLAYYGLYGFSLLLKKLFYH